jgi:2-(1,2-epoxy-1,2-dihydrophenyl)acetyl-CoA isomerase
MAAAVFASCKDFNPADYNNVVLLETIGRVALVTFNRGAAMNTFNGDLCAGFAKATELVEDDDEVACMVVTGSGRAFSAGGDLNAFASADAPAKEGQVARKKLHVPTQTHVRYLRANMREMSQRLREMDKVTFAAVNGACAGAGFSLACACDLRYCSEKAVFATAFVNAGLSGDFGGTWTLPRIVGPAKARELYLLSEKFRAPEALAMGLVSKVLPHGELVDAVVRIAAKAAAAPPLALRRIKQNLNDADRISWPEALDNEADRHSRLYYSADHLEAAKAFTQKREGAFSTPRTEPWQQSKL